MDSLPQKEPTMSSWTWSTEQLGALEWFVTGSGNVALRARAGCAKTTTVVEGCVRSREAKAYDYVVMTAFNVPIAQELTKKLGERGASDAVEARTFHSIGFQVARQRVRGLSTDKDRGYNIARSVAGEDAPGEIVKLIRDLASIGKNVKPLDTTVEDLVLLAEDYELLPDEEWAEEGWTDEKVALCAHSAMERSLTRDQADRPVFDFDDQLFVPLRKKWFHGKAQLLVVDEVQDFNPLKLEIATRLLAKNGRACMVGDDRQAIYGWNGADANAFDRMKAAFNAEERKLTTTFRCARKIVEMAQRIVPDIQAAATAPEGVVRLGGRDEMVAKAEPGDFVISRKKAPLVAACLGILKEGKSARIRGQDIGRSLVTLVRKIADKVSSMPAFIARLEKYSEKERKRALIKAGDNERKKEDLLQEIDDRQETLVVLSEGMTGPQELATRIERLFSDEKGGPGHVTLGTVHGMKGLEANRVWLLGETFVSKRRAPQAAREELNLQYVAITRARETLIWVGMTPPGMELR
jgi:superfamily I DNA/RNA helicase